MGIRGLTLLTLAFSCLVSFSWSHKPHYMISMPKAIVPGSEHTVDVMVEVDSPIVVRIDTRRSQKGATIIGRKQLLRNGRGQVKYIIPFPSFVGYYLFLDIHIFLCNMCPEECLNNPPNRIISRSVVLPTIRGSLVIITDTSQPIYKPKDVIKFRVIAVYPKTLKQSYMYISGKQVRMKDLKFDSITLRTPGKSIVGQWHNVTWLRAFKGFTFRLSRDPPFGLWRIVSKVGKTKEVETFLVKPFVIPKFVVSINQPERIFYRAKNVTFEVCAVFNTGLALAKAQIKAQLCQSSSKSSKDPKSCTEVKTKTIKGPQKCETFTVTRAELIKLMKNKWWGFFYVKASVLGSSTQGIVKKVELGGSFTYKEYYFLNKSPRIFRPKLPYYGRVQLLTFAGQPVPHKKVNLTVFARTRRWEKIWGYTDIRITDKIGHIDFQTPPFPAVSDIATVHCQYEESPKVIISTWITARRMHSMSGNYLQIYPLNRMPKQNPCSDDCKALTLKLQATVPLDNRVIKVFIASRGDIIKTQVFYPKTEVPQQCRNTNDDELGHYQCLFEGAKCNIEIRCLRGWTGANCFTPVCKNCTSKVCVAPGKCLENTVKPKAERNNGYGTIPHQINGVYDYTDNKENIQILQFFQREISIQIPPGMFPRSNIIIWTTHTEKGTAEYLAASVMLKELQDCFYNLSPTKFTFDAEKAKPGQRVTATVKASGTDRHCSLSIIDVGMNAFGGSGGPTLEDIWDQLMSLSYSWLGYQWRDPYRDMVSRHCTNGTAKTGSRARRFHGGWFLRLRDASTIFRDAGLLVLSSVKLMTSPCFRYYMKFSRMVAGVTASQRNMVNLKQMIKGKVRKFFPASAAFDYILNPSKKMYIKLPDTITRWRSTFYCLSSNGLGVSRPSSILSFQIFYITASVPPTVQLGETLTFPVIIFNYQFGCYQFDVRLQNSTNYAIVGKYWQIPCSCTPGPTVTFFTIKPLTIGSFPIALSGKAFKTFACPSTQLKPHPQYDAVSIILNVIAPGIPVVWPHGKVVCVDNNVTVAQLTTHVPEKQFDIIPKSERAYFIYSGSILGAPMDNLQGLVVLPYGCGEQNMITLVPSLYILEFLSATNSRQPELRKKAIKYLRIGIRNQMKYRRSDGSYAIWGERSKKGSTWLSRFVFSVFMKAVKYVHLKLSDLESIWNFIISTQQDDGCFKEYGRVYSSNLRGGLSNVKDAVTLSAYVTLGVLDARDYLKQNIRMMMLPAGKVSFYRNQVKQVLDKAMKCQIDYLKANPMENLSTFAVVLRSYLFNRYDPQATISRELFNLTMSRMEKNPEQYWKEFGETQTLPSGRWSSAVVEITAYGTLARMEVTNKNDILKVQPNIRWLTNQRNDRGGWQSTQDTVVALLALTEFAIGLGGLRAGEVDLNLKVTYRKPGVPDKQFAAMITPSTQYILYRKSAPVNSQVNVQVNGSGCVVLQTITLFNVKQIKVQKPPFKLNTSAGPFKCTECVAARIIIVIQYIGPPNTASGMVILVIRMSSGWEPMVGESRRLVKEYSKKFKLKRVEIDAVKTMRLYFNVILRNSISLEVRVIRKFKVKNVEPAMIEAYNYYRPDVSIHTTQKLPE